MSTWAIEGVAFSPAAGEDGCLVRTALLLVVSVVVSVLAVIFGNKPTRRTRLIGRWRKRRPTL